MRKIILLLCLIFSGVRSFAQPGSIDYSFLPDDFDFSAMVIAHQADGKIITGGHGKFIVRFNYDGSRDSTFNVGLGLNGSYPSVSSIAVQQDGKILVAGEFDSYDGNLCSNIVRLNYDGSFDVTFGQGTGFNNGVSTLAINDDGKIIAGGAFTAYSGALFNRIVCLNADGSVDAGFNPGSGFDGLVTKILLYPDGRIMAGGGFTSFNGATRNHMACLKPDGSLYPFFDPGTAISTFRDFAFQPDEKFVVINYGFPVSGLIRLNKHGYQDATFNSQLVSAFDDFVYSVATQPDGKIIACGAFYHVSGVEQYCVARFDIDGNTDNTFDIGSGFAPQTYTVHPLPDGKIMIGGYFNNYNAIDSIYIRELARLNGDNISGVNDIVFKKSILLFPIPAINTLSIQSEGFSKQYAIKIFNALGQEVFDSPVPISTIDISLLSNGLYYLMLESDDEVGVKKFEVSK